MKKGKTNGAGSWLLSNLKCPNLKTIVLRNHLDDREVSEEELVKFFTSYGDKLLKANISILKDTISEESCKKLAVW